MELYIRRYGALAAIAVCVMIGSPIKSVRAAAMSFTSTVTFSSPIASSPSNPIPLSFSFPGSLIDIESIVISGTFSSPNGWDYNEKFAFSAGPGGPTGASYYYQRPGVPVPKYSFTLDLFSAPTFATHDQYVYTVLPSGDPAGFTAYLLSELGTGGSVDFYFLPQNVVVYDWASSFNLQSVSLTVVGVDPPPPPSVGTAPVPGSGLLFASGAVALWFGSRRGKPGSGNPWSWRRRRDRMCATAD
jgi:hypothetical protein